jgi:hypothetical protein
MRAIRILLIGAPLLLAACGIVAGLDGYDLSENVTAGDAGNGQKNDGSVSNADGSTSSGAPDSGFAVRDGATIVEASVISDASTGMSDDTGPPIMNCMLTQNGQGCGHDASSCCSGICNEKHTCTSNTCVAFNQGCKNDLNAGFGYISATDNCCVNTYCQPNQNSADQGSCQACVPNNAQTPARAVNVFGKDVPVFYDHACCSGNSPDNQGYCH